MNGDAALHTKYRPTTLKELVGQTHIVSSLRRLLRENPPHTFLFVGPSGCGKTTLARIVATAVGCSPAGILELNAANHNGVDEIRSVIDGARYRAMGETPTKMVILDECHMLSKAAWQPLLKATEEPPPHLFWAFCTTEAAKVPDTMKTRCHSYEVKPVPSGSLYDLLADVRQKEGMSIEDEILQLCAKEAGGSPRQALVNMSMVRHAKDRQEAYQVLALSSEDEGSSGIKLAKMLVVGFRWRDAVLLIKQLGDEESAETIRLIVVNYVGKALLDAKDDKKAMRLLAVLDAFSQPFYGAEKRAPLLLAIGRLAFE